MFLEADGFPAHPFFEILPREGSLLSPMRGRTALGCLSATCFDLVLCIYPLLRHGISWRLVHIWGPHAVHVSPEVATAYQTAALLTAALPRTIVVCSQPARTITFLPCLAHHNALECLSLGFVQ